MTIIDEQFIFYDSTHPHSKGCDVKFCSFKCVRQFVENNVNEPIFANSGWILYIMEEKL